MRMVVATKNAKQQGGAHRHGGDGKSRRLAVEPAEAEAAEPAVTALVATTRSCRELNIDTCGVIGLKTLVS